MRWLRQALRILLVAGALRIGSLLFAYFFGAAAVERHHLESTFFVLVPVALVYLGVLPQASDRPFERNRMRAPILVGAGAIAVLLLYWRALGAGWLSDDWVLQDWARRGEFAPSTHEFVRPVPLLLWRALFALGGGPAATHAVNVGLHVVSATLTALLARELGASRQTAWSCWAIFLVWPTQVEAVVWAAAVFDSVVTACVLALVLLYVRWAPAFTLRRALLLLAIAAAAVLAKETGVAVPALLLVVSVPRWVRKFPARAEVLAFASLSSWCGLYLVWRVALRPQVSGPQVPLLTRYTAKELVSRTFAALGVPFDAGTIANHTLLVASVAFAFVFFSVLMLVSARARRPAHLLAVQGLAWCLIAAAPALGYLLIGPNLQGSRYVYLAAAGWAWFAGAVTQTQDSATRRLDWVQAIVLSALVGLAVAQDRVLVSDWRTSGDIRDAILDQARALAAREGCSGMRLVNPPPPYKGTQLFLNGFEQAFQSVSPGRGGTPCTVRWDGATLHRE